MNNHDRSLDDIQSDIRHTRGRLDKTLSAVEHRLEPGQLMEQGVGYLRNHGVTEYFVSLGESAKRQPLPLALVGASLAWLVFSDNRDRVRSGHAREGALDSSSSTDAERGQTKSIFKGAGDDAADKLAATGHAAADMAADMRDKISHGAQQATRSISDTVVAARERAEELGASARRGAQQVKNGYGQMVEEQPLALGAIGLAMGALLAALTPRTRQEDRLMGSTSDLLKDEAKDVGREKLAQAKEVTSAAKDAAVAKANEQTSGASSRHSSDEPPAPSSAESIAPNSSVTTGSSSASARTPTGHSATPSPGESSASRTEQSGPPRSAASPAGAAGSPASSVTASESSLPKPADRSGASTHLKEYKP